MTLPVWATDPSSLLLSEAQYDALPEDLAQSIEVVDGSVILCESPTPEHQRVSFNLVVALKTARPDHPRIDVLQNTDMRYVRANPHVTGDEQRRFTMRRPDVSVLHCLEPGTRMTSADVIAAIEITSGNSQTDFQDKKAEYAAQRIPVYLVVVMDGTAINSIEEYRQDWSGRSYQLAAIHRDVLDADLTEGLKVTVPFSTLERL